MPTNPAVPADVTVTPYSEPWGSGLYVDPVWSGVDRPDTGGWAVKDQRMADRLTRALYAGVAVRYDGIGTDIDGNTYVLATHLVSGRTMNADLRRLGF